MGIDSVMHVILSSISYYTTLIITILCLLSLILPQSADNNIIMDISNPFSLSSIDPIRNDSDDKEIITAWEVCSHSLMLTSDCNMNVIKFERNIMDHFFASRDDS